MRPQVPQLLLSPSKLTHEPPQPVRPAGQSRMQLPWWHWKPLPQTRPQPPQLSGSLWVLTQVPAQRRGRSAGQAQVPALQLWPPLQARLQLPQWLASFCRSTQLAPQAVRPLVQVSAQTPAAQL
jgi:hypothetical protein